MLDRIDIDRRGPSRGALILAALAGALFGGLAVGATGLGILSLTSTSVSALSGVVVIGVALILAVCLMWNLKTRSSAERQSQLLATEIELTRSEIVAARDRARKLVGVPIEGRNSTRP